MVDKVGTVLSRSQTKQELQSSFDKRFENEILLHSNPLGTQLRFAMSINAYIAIRAMPIILPEA